MLARQAGLLVSNGPLLRLPVDTKHCRLPSLTLFKEKLTPSLVKLMVSSCTCLRDELLRVSSSSGVCWGRAAECIHFGYCLTLRMHRQGDGLLFLSLKLMSAPLSTAWFCLDF